LHNCNCDFFLMKDAYAILFFFFPLFWEGFSFGQVKVFIYLINFFFLGNLINSYFRSNCKVAACEQVAFLVQYIFFIWSYVSIYLTTTGLRVYIIGLNHIYYIPKIQLSYQCPAHFVCEEKKTIFFTWRHVIFSVTKKRKSITYVFFSFGRSLNPGLYI